MSLGSRCQIAHWIDYIIGSVLRGANSGPATNEYVKKNSMNMKVGMKRKSRDICTRAAVTARWLPISKQGVPKVMERVCTDGPPYIGAP